MKEVAIMSGDVEQYDTDMHLMCLNGRATVLRTKIQLARHAGQSVWYVRYVVESLDRLSRQSVPSVEITASDASNAKAEAVKLVCRGAALMLPSAKPEALTVPRLVWHPVV